MVQFLKTYINPQGKKIIITICSNIVQKWLGQLDYKYKNIYKDVFIDEYEQSNIVQDLKISQKG